MSGSGLREGLAFGWLGSINFLTAVMVCKINISKVDCSIVEILVQNLGNLKSWYIPLYFVLCNSVLSEAKLCLRGLFFRLHSSRL